MSLPVAVFVVHELFAYLRWYELLHVRQAVFQTRGLTRCSFVDLKHMATDLMDTFK